MTKATFDRFPFGRVTGDIRALVKGRDGGYVTVLLPGGDVVDVPVGDIIIGERHSPAGASEMIGTRDGGTL